MKKLVLLLLLGALTSPLWALRPGETAAELYQVKWLNRTPGKLLTNSLDRDQAPEYTLLTFLLTHGPNTRETIQMLNLLGHRYTGKLKCLALTPDPESDARTLLQNQLDASPVYWGLDTRRQHTPKYTGASWIFPLSFLIDRDNHIVWRGELGDAPEALEQAYAGKLDPELEAEIAPMIDEMQLQMRQNNVRRLRQLADQIFERFPGHPGALRQLLFVLENTNRVPEALAVLKKQLKTAPDSARLYFTALEMLQRYAPRFDAELPDLTRQFMVHIAAPAPRYLMAFQLLRGFFLNPVAFEAAAQLVKSPLPAAPGEQISAWLCRALVAQECGNLPLASQQLNEAEKLLQQHPNAETKRQIDEVKRYVETLKKYRN